MLFIILSIYIISVIINLLVCKYIIYKDKGKYGERLSDTDTEFLMSFAPIINTTLIFIYILLTIYIYCIKPLKKYIIYDVWYFGYNLCDYYVYYNML